MSGTIHYGPVWNKPNGSAISFSLCDVEDCDEYTCRVLSNDAPSVTCPHCKAILSQQNNEVKP
jgi:hypothetical protein